MDAFQALNMFHHRQIVINYYKNDELVDRNGMTFDTISIKRNELKLIKDDMPVFSIPIEDDTQFAPSGRIKNHYYLHTGDLANRTELYFP